MATRRLTRSLAYAWVAILAGAVLGPALLPGFVLSYDLVFTPRQDLLPGAIGLGGGLPRAVPQDAVVAIVEAVLPGSVLEKIVLLAIPLLAGWGMLRLLPSTAAGVVAATLAVLNPFVAQRLVIGHWGLLLAYALIPWALLLARRLRAGGDPWDALRLLLLVAAGSITPSGSLLMAILAVPPALLPGSAYPVRLRIALGSAVTLTWLPWLIPALLHPLGTAGDPDGTSVFGLRADTPGGVLVSAITGGGIWNADAVLPSRGTALSLALGALVLGLAAWGARDLGRCLGRGVATWWVAVALGGLLAALASAVAPGAWGAIVEVIPGGGLVRDAHKLLAPWVLLVAVAAGMGASRGLRLARDRATRGAVLAALVLVPVACQIDLLWGAGGRLQAVAYPDDWAVVRATLQQDARPGDVVSFPWMAFRQFDWNPGRTVLDPAPRWLPRTTVVADGLLVATPSGTVEVAGDDPRALAVSRAVAGSEPLDEALLPLGIGWALVARGTPGPVPDLAGWVPVVEGADLTLYAAPVAPAPAAPAEHLNLVAGVDLAVLGVLLAGLAALGLRRVRVREARRLVR